jgi:hypothetical protein
MFCFYIAPFTLNALFAGIFILLFFFAIFQLLTGKYVGKAKSILPPEVETKRIAIATKHNQIAGLMALSVFAGIFLIVELLRGLPRTWKIVAIVALGIAEIHAIRSLFRYDEELCGRFGFVCPHCHKPLYEPRSFINVNGLCPKCRKSVLPTSHSQGSVVSARSRYPHDLSGVNAVGCQLNALRSRCDTL